MSRVGGLKTVIRVLVFALALSISGCGYDIGRDGDVIYRKDVSRAKKDLVKIAAGLESYYGEHGHYPVSPGLGDSGSTITLRGILTDNVEATKYNQVPNEVLEALPHRSGKAKVYDPFATRRTTQYFYYSAGDAYLLSSVGPDSAIDSLAVIDGSSQPARLDELVSANSYDPTNGLVSLGDIILYGRLGRSVEPDWK